MFSLSEENYLKAILHLQKTSKSGVSTNAIAEEMQNQSLFCDRYGKEALRKRSGYLTKNTKEYICRIVDEKPLYRLLGSTDCGKCF